MEGYPRSVDSDSWRLASFAVRGSLLYGVMEEDHRVYTSPLQLVLAGKSPQWTLASRPWVANIAVSENRIYGVGWDQAIYSQNRHQMKQNSWWTRAGLDGKVLAVAAFRDTLYAVLSDHKIYLHKEEGHAGKTWSLLVDSASSFRGLAAAGDRLYCISKRNRVHRLKVPDTEVKEHEWEEASRGKSVAITADAERLYCLGMDNAMYIWRLACWPFESKPLRAPLSAVEASQVQQVPSVGQLVVPPGEQFLPVPHIPRERAATKAVDAIRFVCISDTHSMHRVLTRKLPKGDVLLHAGDLTNNGSKSELLDVAAWFAEVQPNFRHIIAIAGNHDHFLAKVPREAVSPIDESLSAWSRKPSVGTWFGLYTAQQRCCNTWRASCCYLQDQSVTVSAADSSWSAVVHGSPWQPEYCNIRNAFTQPRGAALRTRWQAVPENVDVLVTHGPPLGRRDEVYQPSRIHVGCADLLNELRDRSRPPRILLSGHIHEGYGFSFDGHTLFVNASCKPKGNNRSGGAINNPLVVDLPRDPSLPAAVVEL